MNNNVLITGGAGFIGSNLALKLITLGYTVTVLDNLSEQIHGNPEISSLFQSIKDKVNFIRGDVRNKDDWSKALKNQNVVVHLAAETGTGQSMYEVQKYVDVNSNGTALFLDYLVNEKHAVNKVIIASSRAIYGEGKYKCNTHGSVYPTERLENDLLKTERSVLKYIDVEINDDQFASLVSFTFNVGAAALQRSILRQKIN